jgi:SAM-dependent methyltransferase
MQNQNDYDKVAHLYDKYVQVELDFEFFREYAGSCSGPVLELMAGTGRVSKAIFDCCPNLTCVDISRKMLRRLSRGFAGAKRRPNVVCADVRSLPLEICYDLVIIPFNSFTELTEPTAQLRALGEVHRVLSQHGTFICTVHNPVVRVRSLDGMERLLGRFPMAGDQGFELWATGSLDPSTGLAQSKQESLMFDKSGRLVDHHQQDVRFALITEARFRDLCGVCGFDVVQVVGDYDGSPYDPDTSPFLIFTMRKT